MVKFFMLGKKQTKQQTKQQGKKVTGERETENAKVKNKMRQNQFLSMEHSFWPIRFAFNLSSDVPIFFPFIDCCLKLKRTEKKHLTKYTQMRYVVLMWQNVSLQ